MPFDLTCRCGKLLRVADKYAGSQGRCPVCGEVLDLPLPAAQISDAAPSPPEPVQTATDSSASLELQQSDPNRYTVTELPRESVDTTSELADGARPDYKLVSLT